MSERTYRVATGPTRLGYACHRIELPYTGMQLADSYLWALTERGLWRKIRRRLRREDRRRRQRERERYVDVDAGEVA